MPNQEHEFDELNRLISSATGSGIHDEEAFTERKKKEALDIEDIKTRKEYNELLKQNREQRLKYAKWIFTFTCMWAGVIFLIIIANCIRTLKGIKLFNGLSDTVLITLITTTTVNFFGFFLLVVKYLFYTGPEKSQ